MRAAALLVLLASSALAQAPRWTEDQTRKQVLLADARGAILRGTQETITAQADLSRLGVAGQLGVPTNGKVCLNATTNTICFTYDGVNGHFTGANLINDNGSYIASNGFQGPVNAVGTNSLSLSGAGSMVDDATAIGTTLRSSINMTNAAAKVTSFRNQNVEVASVSMDGYIRSTTPESLFSLNIGAQIAAGAAIYGGGRLPPTRANTITSLSFYVAIASAGAGTTTFTVTDGVSTCSFAIDCVSGVTLTTGAKYQATTSGTCAFAGNAALVVGSSASTCATTRPTINNLTTLGSWQ